MLWARVNHLNIIHTDFVIVTSSFLFLLVLIVESTIHLKYSKTCANMIVNKDQILIAALTDLRNKITRQQTPPASSNNFLSFPLAVFIDNFDCNFK